MSTYLTLTFELLGPNAGSIDGDTGTIKLVGQIASMSLQDTADKLHRTINTRLKSGPDGVRLFPLRVAISQDPVYTERDTEWTPTGKD